MLFIWTITVQYIQLYLILLQTLKYQQEEISAGNIQYIKMICGLLFESQNLRLTGFQIC